MTPTLTLIIYESICFLGSIYVSSFTYPMCKMHHKLVKNKKYVPNLLHDERYLIKYGPNSEEFNES